jgi:sucrose phosphorylase
VTAWITLGEPGVVDRNRTAKRFDQPAQSAGQTPVANEPDGLSIEHKGVRFPGIYFHSLFGSRKYHDGLAQTGRYRTINREKLDADALLKDLQNLATMRAQVYYQFCRLLAIRTREAAFHPLGYQTILNIGNSIFGIEPTSLNGKQRVIALHNVAGEPVNATFHARGARRWRDLVGNGRQYEVSSDNIQVTLDPYQVCWLKPV